MIRLLFIFFILTCFTISCAPSGNQSEESSATEDAAPTSTTPPPAEVDPYSWTQLTDNASYPKAYNYQLFAKDNKLYAFHTDVVWESTDGKNWSKTGLKNILGNQAFLDYIEFNDAIYALGSFSGKISNHVLTSQISRTTDMKKWDIVAKQSNLPKRFLYHPFVFQNKIWIIGGNDGMTIYNDAWASTDGIDWQKVADELPFSAQHSQHFVILKDKIYMLGQDVWVSENGLDWDQVAPSISEPSFSNYTPVVYDDKIWLLGNGLKGKIGSEVWYSENGATWKKQEAPWSARIAVAACVFNNELVMTGGKYSGSDAVGSDQAYNNDVWAMRKKENN